MRVYEVWSIYIIFNILYETLWKYFVIYDIIGTSKFYEEKYIYPHFYQMLDYRLTNICIFLECLRLFRCKEKNQNKQISWIGIAPSHSAMGQSGSLDFVQVDPAFRAWEFLSSQEEREDSIRQAQKAWAQANLYPVSCILMVHSSSYVDTLFYITTL